MRIGSLNLVAKSLVMQDMSVGREGIRGGESGGEIVLVVIRDARSMVMSLSAAEGVLMEGAAIREFLMVNAGKVAAIGQWSRALGIGAEGGVG